jgi:hypothetical protein
VYLNREVRECVAFLCSRSKGDNVSEPTPEGTCFLLTAFGSDSRSYRYIVTAKHVLEGLTRKGTIHLRLNSGKRTVGQPGTGVFYFELEKTGWIFHPDPVVDLVVAPLEAVVKPGQTTHGGLLMFDLPFDAIIQTPTHLAAIGRQWPPLEAEEILFIGLMLQFQGVSMNLPIVRTGSIALITDDPIKGFYGPSKYHVINAQAYQGNSGAPVWVQYDDTLYLLGVLAFAFPELEELRKMPGNEIQAFYNLGVSLVTPIERVVDIVNSDEEQRRRGEGTSRTKPGIPLSGGLVPESIVSGEIRFNPQQFTREDFEAALRRVSRRRQPSQPDEASSETSE